jgi:hypothetical protein
MAGLAILLKDRSDVPSERDVRITSDILRCKIRAGETNRRKDRERT